MVTKTEGSVTWQTVSGAFGFILVAGFAWWMTTVWNIQCAQADDISNMKARMLVIESKMDNLSGQLREVKTGVDSLVNTLVKKNVS